MRPFGAWFGRLAMAGACLLGAGCGGGGDVPDPDSDSRAATAKPALQGPAARVQEAEPEPAAKAEAPALANATTSAAPTLALAKPDETPAQAPAEPAAPTTKGDASGTEDMLRMSSSPSPATPSAPGTSAAPGAAAPGASGLANATGPAPGGGQPGQPGAPGANEAGPRGRRFAGGGGGGSEAAPPPGQGGMPASYPGSAEGPGGSAAAAMAGGAMANQSGQGRPGDPGAPGAPGRSNGPGESGFGAMAGAGGPGEAGNQDPLLRGAAAFQRPSTAVQAFLAAVRAKDKERLAQTVALHAPTEAAEKHRKIFSAIAEQSITDDELDEMAKTLDGYQVVSQLAAYSTGKIGILVSKMSGRDRLQRTITTRKEREGWKVLDVDGVMDFKYIPTPTRRGRGR